MGDSELRQSAISQWAPFRWPMAIVALALILLVAFGISLWFIFKSVQKTGETGIAAFKAASEGASRVAEKFTKGTITSTFTAAIPTLAHTDGGNLELASAQTTESFSSTDVKTVMWDWVYLGTTVTEIKVPVTYRYHLRLAEPWRLDVSGNTCIVYCPAIHPTLPPAIDTAHMEKRSERGWARLNAGEQMANLEKNITPTLSVYARDPRHVALVRDECRKTVAEFVRNWLLKEDQWRNDRFHAIIVVFPDETKHNLEQLPATLELSPQSQGVTLPTPPVESSRP